MSSYRILQSIILFLIGLFLHDGLVDAFVPSTSSLRIIRYTSVSINVAESLIPHRFTSSRRQIQQCSGSSNSNNRLDNTRVTNKFTILFGKKDAREQGNERKSKTERVRKVKDDVIEVEGVVIESLPNAMFRCTIDGASDTQEPILATISGKIRKNFVKILVGDKVLIELSPYDLTRGRITFRYR